MDKAGSIGRLRVRSAQSVDQLNCRYDANSVNNPYGEYGSKYLNKSANNPYATDTPKLYDSLGNYRCELSSNPHATGGKPAPGSANTAPRASMVATA